MNYGANVDLVLPDVWRQRDSPRRTAKLFPMLSVRFGGKNLATVANSKRFTETAREPMGTRNHPSHNDSRRGNGENFTSDRPRKRTTSVW
jgi:hypothetical protein